MFKFIVTCEICNKEWQDTSIKEYERAVISYRGTSYFFDICEECFSDSNIKHSLRTIWNNCFGKRKKF